MLKRWNFLKTGFYEGIKVEQVIQEIVDINFDLYKRITDDPTFGDILKNHLFDEYLRTHQFPEDDGS